MAHIRSRLCNLPYGDQAQFLRADLFRRIGGSPEIPIMEDYELARRLRRLGPVATCPIAVVTSARRWYTLGILRATLINQAIIVGYALGVPPERLERWYQRDAAR